MVFSFFSLGLGYLFCGAFLDPGILVYRVGDEKGYNEITRECLIYVLRGKKGSFIAHCTLHVLI